MVWVYLIAYFIAFIVWFFVLAKKMLTISQRIRNFVADESDVDWLIRRRGRKVGFALIVLSFATGSLLGHVLCSLFGIPD